jgi:hypothetical protein
VDTLATLGRTLGFSLGAGVNLYATVAILGLAQRWQLVTLPEQFRVFDHDGVIAVALALYVIEFVADKIPWVDTLWDAVHSFIRPLGGALVAIASQGQASPTMMVLVGLLGHQGGCARRGEFEPRAVHELVSQLRRGRVRRRAGGAGAVASGGGARRDAGDARHVSRVRGVDRARLAAAVREATTGLTSSRRGAMTPRCGTSSTSAARSCS